MYNIDIVVDWLINKEGICFCLFDFVEVVLCLLDGYVVIDIMDGNELLFLEYYFCFECGFIVFELELCFFFFNVFFGFCLICDGLGIKLEVDIDLVILDKSKIFREGVLVFWNLILLNYYLMMLE